MPCWEVALVDIDEVMEHRGRDEAALQRCVQRVVVAADTGGEAVLLDASEQGLGQAICDRAMGIRVLFPSALAQGAVVIGEEAVDGPLADFVERAIGCGR